MRMRVREGRVWRCCFISAEFVGDRGFGGAVLSVRSLSVTVLHSSTHTYIQATSYNRVCRTSATAFMRVFLPVNVFISTNKAPVHCISETVSEHRSTAAYRRVSRCGFFGFYYQFYFWYFDR